MSEMITCAHCDRYIRTEERTCPFCDAAVVGSAPSTSGRSSVSRISRAAAFAARAALVTGVTTTAIACGNERNEDEGVNAAAVDTTPDAGAQVGDQATEVMADAGGPIRVDSPNLDSGVASGDAASGDIDAEEDDAGFVYIPIYGGPFPSSDRAKV